MARSLDPGAHPPGGLPVMKLVTYLPPTDTRATQLGVLLADVQAPAAGVVLNLARAFAHAAGARSFAPRSMGGLLAAGPAMLDAVRDLLADLGLDQQAAPSAEQCHQLGTAVFPLADVQLVAPLPRPNTLRDFYAFEAHVRAARALRGLDMIPEWYEIPVFYFSNPEAIIGP